MTSEDSVTTDDADDPSAYAAWSALHRPSPEARAVLRNAALADVARWKEPLRAAILRTHGLVVPDGLFAYWGFARSLDPDARAALHEIGVSPGGLLEVFDALLAVDANPALLRTLGGLDIRLESRYYRDPPELFTFAYGNTDGLHYGLWFDDLRGAPQGIGSYYAHAGGEIALDRMSPLDLVRDEAEQYQEVMREGSTLAEVEEPEFRDLLRFRADVLFEALAAWADAGGGSADDDPGLAPDEPRSKTADGAGAIAAGGSSSRSSSTDGKSAVEGDFAARAQAAGAALEQGNPAEALCLGRDLHWGSGRNLARERAAREWLVRAYRALGRDGLAAIAELHQANRQLGSVAVLTRG
jgi:hypothetical protein